MISEADYREVVGRVREVVRATVPAGTTALVISRGDPDLVELPGRRGWHFPQGPDGGYAGEYPETGSEAVAHLEDLRRKGGEYLVVPGTALWWLEHYPELGRHVGERCRLVADVEGTCRVFALEGSGAGRRDPAGGTDPDVRALRATPSRADERLVSVLESLLPRGAGVVWMCPPGVAPPTLDGRRAWSLPGDAPSLGARDDGGGLFERLERLREAGGEFLVVPADGTADRNGVASPGRGGCASWPTRLDGRYPRVARREHLCSIYRLRPPSEETAAVERLRRRSVDG